MPTALQLAGAISVKIGLAIVIFGVLRRGLHRRCWSFLVYLLAVLIFSSVEMAAQMLDGVAALEWFRSWNFWHVEQTVFEVVKLALAVELGIRVVAAFPGTWRLARALLGAALLTTTAQKCLRTSELGMGNVLKHPRQRFHNR